MDFIDKIKDIRKAKENNKLVIFVGAGVSKNSNIPTWWELIKVFADNLGINKCEDCKFKDKVVCSNECEQKYNFSQDEFLKIPQYFYDNDSSENHKDYKQIIVDTLGVNVEANLINDIILEFLPDHIITTNYDKLLENSKNSNSKLYKCIYEDKDLLTECGNNYIIKMHGDIDNLDSIVLKENDYISYSQTHVLIETKIKSLLIDHTFLFIGYSLNDYNLKLIIGWIDYLAKEKNVQMNRPKNYIIQIGTKKTEDYIEAYLQANNVFVINTYELPKGIKEKYSNINLPRFGKEVYACLDYVLDKENDYLVEPLVDVLLSKFSIFDEFKRISYEDLISVHSFGRTELKGEGLYFEDANEFEKIANIVKSNKEREIEIKRILLKTGIKYIYLYSQNIEIKVDGESNISNELFKLYLDNKYDDILIKLENISDKNLFVYYSYLLKSDNYDKTEYLAAFNKYSNKAIESKSLYDLIIYQYNKIAVNKITFKEVDADWEEFNKIISHIPMELKKAYGFIEKISSNIKGNLTKLKELFEEHENLFLHKDNKVYNGVCPIGKIPELMGLSYDYYFYFKFNNLTIDYFSNPREYFEFYLRAILCTYNPNKNIKVNSIWGSGTQFKEYEINEYDLDMLVKYTEPKKLISWMKEYKVRKVKLADDVNIIEKFSNFCISLKSLRNTSMIDKLHSFVIILSKVDLKIKEKNAVLQIINNLINLSEEYYYGFILNYIESISYIVKEFCKDNRLEFKSLLLKLLDINIIKQAKANPYINNDLKETINSLVDYCDDEIRKKIDEIIKNEDSKKEKKESIVMFIKFLNEEQKNKYSAILASKNLEYLDSGDMFWCIYEGILSCDGQIVNKYTEIINEEIRIRGGSTNAKIFPDNLARAVECCIVLYLAGKMSNISFLKQYKDYSNFLEFIFEPDSFEYSQIDINNYMWENIMKNKEYLDIILKYKNELNIDNLKHSIENGVATEKEKKFYYRYLSTDAEFWTIK